MKLRDYQRKSIDDLFEWFANNPEGNPCLVLPTGSGKSVIIAELCKIIIQQWPDQRILMLSHVKELIEQNAQKMRAVWRSAPLGIYAASLRKRQVEQITFASIQTVAKRADELGHIDIIIIDEAHTVGHRDEGGYRTLLKWLKEINPSVRIVGLTASPYRLGHGMITDKPAIFDALIEPVGIMDLVSKGFLSPLKSKHARNQINTVGLHKRGGEYVEAELQERVCDNEENVRLVQECILLAGDRKSWLFFCAGIAHAMLVRDILRGHGVPSECVTGETTNREREQILTDFKSGKLKSVTNANVLTTGFDAPNTDLVALMRPTMSPGLYLQMAGRGMRIKEHTDHCLVLDFAGVVSQHGPVTNITPPKRKGGGTEKATEPPMKSCDICFELVPISIRICPECGTAFPPPETESKSLHNDDIMGIEGSEMDVKSWQWRVHTSRTSGKEMLTVDYVGKGLISFIVSEYLTVLHDGYSGDKSRRLLLNMAASAGVDSSLLDFGNIYSIPQAMSAGNPPQTIEYQKSGKFFNVIKRIWNDNN